MTNVFVAAATVFVLLGSILAILQLLYAREWHGTWRGHRLRYRNGVLGERLYIDDVLVAEKQSMGLSEARLEAKLPGSARGERVVGLIVAQGATIRGTLYVDGVWCGGDRPPELPEGAVPANGPQPQDERWAAAVHLLDAVVRRGGAEAALATRVREGLCDVLLAIEDAEATRASMAALGGASDDGGVLANLRDQAERLIGAARDLHGNPGVRAIGVDELLHEAHATAEVAHATTPPALRTRGRHEI